MLTIPDLPVANGLRIHHIGIAVKNIDATRKSYEALGISISHEESIPQEQVRIAFLQMDGTLLELLQPIEKDSHLERFLQRRGEGLHHLALEVPDIQATLQEMKAKGVRLINDFIRTGAAGHRYFFIHPSSAGGVLIEIVECAVDLPKLMREML
jgi:LAO/AO transport system kinase